MSARSSIGIIGGGAMGSAIARIVTETGLYTPQTCFVFDRNEKRRQALKGFPCTVVESFNELVKSSDILVLAVKPQSAFELFRQMRGRVSSRTIISIMAGVTLATITRELETVRVVRAMPNMPARIGRGMTVWIAGPGVRSKEKDAARAIFRAFGKELEVSDENLIDAATAISGSGPAYFFLLAEALEDAALQFGFSSEEIRFLIREMLRGASELYAQTHESPAALRGQITSKGGTTDAALKTLHLHEFVIQWRRALGRAHGRARELSLDTTI